VLPFVGVHGIGRRAMHLRCGLCGQSNDQLHAFDNRHDDSPITSAQHPVHHNDVAVIDAVFAH
jgi:hypothetical protein